MSTEARVETFEEKDNREQEKLRKAYNEALEQLTKDESQRASFGLGSGKPLTFEEVAKKVVETKGYVREAEENVRRQAAQLTHATLDAARKRAHRDYWVERLTREAKS